MDDWSNISPASWLQFGGIGLIAMILIFTVPAILRTWKEQTKARAIEDAKREERFYEQMRLMSADARADRETARLERGEIIKVIERNTSALQCVETGFERLLGHLGHAHHADDANGG